MGARQLVPKPVEGREKTGCAGILSAAPPNVSHVPKPTQHMRMWDGVRTTATNLDTNTNRNGTNLRPGATEDTPPLTQGTKTTTSGRLHTHRRAAPGMDPIGGLNTSPPPK